MGGKKLRVNEVWASGAEIIVGAMNWFLWNAVVDARAGVGFAGYTTMSLVLYTMITSILRKVQVNSEQFAGIADDIYTGALNKYLVYPIPYFSFRFAMHLGSSLMSLVQSSMALAVFWIFAARSSQPLPGVAAVVQFLALVLVSIALRFVINSAIQASAFWFEQIWALLVLFSFLIALLGGQLIPLSLYPAWAQSILSYTPFPILAALPAEALLGKLLWPDFFWGLGVGVIWSMIFHGVGNLVFRMGVRNYSGIGA